MPVPTIRMMPPCLCRAAGGAFALALLATTVLPAVAQDDDLTFEQRMIRKLMGGGEGAGIDYRERSPLVIPPSRDLPPPESTANVEHTPSWPKDPDKAAGRASGGPMSADYNERESSRNLSRRELRRGTIASKTGPQAPVVTLGDAQSGRALLPSEYNSGETPSLFGMFKLGRSSKPAVFKGEPPRTSLIEPPTGYRTPAPTQPYAPPKDTGSWFTVMNPFNRGLDNDH
jgi:hypothetical protein